MTITLPLSQKPTGFCTPRVDLALTEDERRIIHRLRDGLIESGATVDGRRVSGNADVLRWIIREISRHPISDDFHGSV